MTTKEHLEEIRAFCRARIADRTPWHPWCIAGWKATDAAIEQIQSMRQDTPTWEFVGKPLQVAILAAYPEDMLKP